MMTDAVDALADRIKDEQDALLSEWREQVRALPCARHLDVPTLNDHIPALIDELVSALKSKSDTTIPEALKDGSPPAHGRQRLKDGFDLEEVVAEYNILRGCIHDLAERHQLALQGRLFRILNRVLDGAIGLAVQSYSTQRALEVSERREQYLAFVVHDLRTPLAAIAMASIFLERTLPPKDGKEGAEASRMFNALRRNVRQLEALVTKVMEENSNLETEVGVKLQRRQFDLWPLVEALIHDVHPVSGTSSTELVNDVPEDLTIFADAELLRRIFQNMIANAISYTPRGIVTIGAMQNDGGVECWVKDNGSGIPAALLDKVFDKGESDPDKAAGSGLGLAIAKTFVESHGGTITVDSVEGSGATFRFTLPTQ